MLSIHGACRSAAAGKLLWEFNTGQCKVVVKKTFKTELNDEERKMGCVFIGTTTRTHLGDKRIKEMKLKCKGRGAESTNATSPGRQQQMERKQVCF